jgi:hypothetical protein
LGLLSLLSPVVAIFTYLKFGREPKVDYDGIYERELPTDDSPEVVNAIYANGDIGTPNMDGFEAAILNLIDKKVLKLTKQFDENTETNDLYIEFSGNTQNLKSNEKQVYDILHNFAYGDTLNLSSLNTSLSSEANAKWFMEQYADWCANVEDELEPRVSEEFNDTGTTIMAGLSVGGLVIGVIMAILGIWTELKSGTYAIAGGIFKFAGWQIPASVMKPVKDFASMTTPISIFILGATLSLPDIGKNVNIIAATLFLKLVAVPAFILVVMYSLGYRGPELFIAFSLYATPIAGASFPMAQNMGGDGELQGQLLAISTVASLFTIFLWIMSLTAVGIF